MSVTKKAGEKLKEETLLRNFEKLKAVYPFVFGEDNKTMFEVWNNVLKSKTDDDVNRAFDSWIAENQKKPMPNQIRALCENYEGERTKDQQALNEINYIQNKYKCQFCKDTGFVAVAKADGYDTVCRCHCKSLTPAGELSQRQLSHQFGRWEILDKAGKGTGLPFVGWRPKYQHINWLGGKWGNDVLQ